MFETIKENGFPEEFEGRNVPKSWEMLATFKKEGGGQWISGN